MSNKFARRMGTVHRSFIREILKVTANPEIISFAGGLPNPELFPVSAMDLASREVFADIGASALQYSTTEGDAGLRAIISARYQKRGLAVDPDSILITTGSQQILDIAAKVFLDKGDKVVIERPGYLGAIQAFSIFEPEFVTVSLEDDGPNLQELEAVFKAGAKCFYAVPNFQNPSGVSYSLEKRKAVAELTDKYDVLFVEDDPYGELRFLGKDLPSVYSFCKNPSILCGSFSKIAAPGFRIGWVVAEKEIYDKLVIAKQASDLHTSTVAQAIMRRYLEKNDIEAHVELIKERYGRQRECMVEMIGKYFPDCVSITKPEGGMFLWATMPEGFSSMDLFDKAIKDKVAFVPGRPFFVDGSGENTLRLNFSNSDEARIEEGIKRLGRSIDSFLK
ncbi:MULTISPECIES: PLP-dependent aminotransferase family protein [unclassified Pseudodesulfovibrio]|uniref:aminotransferase-like domain-containing protein n=1 Tax=unclassified Pseudodesulfovibrio TaxID=2661612 RepID=UPI000FEB80DD|nr:MULTISPECIES: PLP-dependent aminotransferase family protein [unclassified Pseudodesulfovibrio]MCJ2164187.1 PLP-dependent aminotransferase family protein [Pseudodesulfovibrio sp. S3-i]RWU05188.1 PLP-dependent aminotransferase family protein [Pseudodesulfovibrio sp. S3]